MKKTKFTDETQFDGTSFNHPKVIKPGFHLATKSVQTGRTYVVATLMVFHMRIPKYMIILFSNREFLMRAIARREEFIKRVRETSPSFKHYVAEFDTDTRCITVCRSKYGFPEGDDFSGFKEVVNREVKRLKEEMILLFKLYMRQHDVNYWPGVGYA